MKFETLGFVILMNLGMYFNQDVDLPPIMEEEETDLAMATEEVEPEVVNDERAIVLFKPPLHYHQPSSSGNLFVDTDLISGFKSKFFFIFKSIY